MIDDLMGKGKPMSEQDEDALNKRHA